MTAFLIRGGHVLRSDGVQRADVVVRDRWVETVGTALDAGDAEVIDADGCWVGPGFVDLHVHFRDPGQTHKEDIGTGSAAAAAGGYTAVVAMPNTEPAIDRPGLARYVVERGAEIGLVEVHSAACVTVARRGEVLAPLTELWESGVRIFTDDGDTVADPDLVRRAMEVLEPLGAVVSQHAVDPVLAGDGHVHEGTVSARLGLAGIPAMAEERVVARDLELVRSTGARYHLQHVSTAAAVDLVAAAKAEGLPVTAEVTPHHLAFSDQDVESLDTSFKMMPPLRSDADRTALRAALVDGTIDAVATDHAPHTPEEKAGPFETTPNGVIGLEWAGAVVNTVVGLGPAAFFDRMSIAPARIAGLQRHGRSVEPGAPANLVVFDPSTEWLAAATRSRSSNAPYLGRRWRGVVRHVLLEGATTHRSAEAIA